MIAETKDFRFAHWPKVFSRWDDWLVALGDGGNIPWTMNLVGD